MTLPEAHLLVQLAIAVCTLVAVWATWVKAARPRVRAFTRLVVAALETLAGREAIHDYTTGRSLPAIPPLHKRLDGIERAQEAQANALQTIAQVQAEQGALHRIASDHEARITSLEDVEAERAVVREENAALFRLLADHNVLDVEDIAGLPKFPTKPGETP